MASDLFPDTILIRPDILSRLDFAALFGNTAPVELELGAGMAPSCSSIRRLTRR